MKKRSKVIKDLILGKIDVLQAIQSLSFMIEDLDDNDDIKKWVESELNGYKDKNNVPKYRIIPTTLIGTVQVGYAVYKNINIPFSDSEAIDLFSKEMVLSPLSNVIQLAKAENENSNHALSMEVNTILVNHYQETNGDVISARRYLSLYAYNNILGSIKDKLLDIFKILEKNYGNLDEMYIDFSDDDKKEETIKDINKVIYNDNSIHIGDGNKINESIVGDKNES